MTDEERYFFDLCGYLIVPEALSPQEVHDLNDAIDANQDKLTSQQTSLAFGSPKLAGTSRRKKLSNLFTMPPPWGQAFRSLLAHPRINPYLNEILGPGFRLDHAHTVLVQETGCEGFTLHGSTGPSFDPNQYYIVRDRKMHNGLTVVAWQTMDVKASDGGFCLVPGSHKSNFPMPAALCRNELYPELIKPIAMKAGDAVIFTEAVLHGTLPWTSPQPRRTILSRYTAANLAYVPYRFDQTLAAVAGELTDTQRAVLEPPYHQHLDRPVIADGPDSQERCDDRSD